MTYNHVGSCVSIKKLTPKICFLDVISTHTSQNFEAIFLAADSDRIFLMYCYFSSFLNESNTKMANYKGLIVLLTLTIVAGGFGSNVLPAAWMESGDNTTLPGPLVYHAIIEDSRGNLWLFGGVDPRTYF